MVHFGAAGWGLSFVVHPMLPAAGGLSHKETRRHQRRSRALRLATVTMFSQSIEAAVDANILGCAAD
jgi:hypothetical protein